MLKLGYEHGGNATDCRCLFSLQGFKYRERLKRRGRKNDGCAVSDAAEDGADTSGTVIERERHAHAVVIGYAKAFAGEASIVHQVAMRQQDAFRRPRCARGV